MMDAPVLIEVLVAETGDRAVDLETPEQARLAARTLVREAREHSHVRKPTVYFLVDGVLAVMHEGSL